MITNVDELAVALMVDLFNEIRIDAEHREFLGLYEVPTPSEVLNTKLHFVHETADGRPVYVVSMEFPKPRSLLGNTTWDSDYVVGDKLTFGFEPPKSITVDISKFKNIIDIMDI